MAAGPNLVIETGAGIAGANCYGVTDGPTTIAACRQYALDRGIALSAVDATISVQMILATDYLESFSEQFVGRPTLYTQALSWPRSLVQFDPDSPYPSNQIPFQLLNGLYQAVIEQFNGIVLQPSVDQSQGGYVLEEKVDVILTKYSEKLGTTSAPLLPKVVALISSLLNPGVALRTVRI